MIQRAVGQGGLFQGSLDCGSTPLRWLYDCGSNQTDSLHREIAHVAANPPVDILFLSHLDSDHVSGLDRLLAEVQVKEVVLPYLREADLSLAICRDIQAGRLAGVFLDFAVDPAGWLTGRGASTVTFIDGHGDDNPDDTGPDGTPETGGGGEGPILYKWSKPPAYVKNVGSAVVQRAAANSIIRTYAGHQLDWALVPYAFAPSDRLIKAFVRELRIQFGPKVSIKHIASQARTAPGREQLRICYDTLWGNHNLVSMSLYSGPQNRRAKNKKVQWKNQWWHNGTDEAGWLSTGDAHLGRAKRREALLKYYERYESRISVLVVPHHGAANYFHRDVISALPNLHFGIAAAGKNSYGHPDKLVKNAFRTQMFCKVSSAASSGFFTEVEL